MISLPINPFSQDAYIGMAMTPSHIAAMSLRADGTIISQAQQKFDQPLFSATDFDIAKLREAYKTVLQTGSFTSRYVSVVIPEKFAYSRVHTFPPLANPEISEAITWQLEKIFPYTKDEIYTDWRLLSRSQTQVKVVITVVTKIFLDNLRYSLQSAGLYPISFEPSASALSRFLPQELSQAIIVAIDAFGSASTLIDGGVPQITSTTYHTPQTAPENIVTQVGNSIVSLINYYAKSVGHTLSGKVVVTGEQASSSIVQLLAQNTHLPVELLTLDQITPDMQTAYAAAKSAVLPPESEQSINLIPPALTQYYHAVSVYQIAGKARFTLGLTAALSVIIALVGFLLVNLFTASHLNTVRDHLSEPVNEATGISLQALTRNANRFNRLFIQKTSPETLLTTVINAIPDTTRVTSLTYNRAKNVIDITGKAEDREGVLAVRDALDDTGQFKPVDLPLTALQTSAGGDFSFQLNIVQQP